MQLLGVLRVDQGAQDILAIDNDLWLHCSECFERLLVAYDVDDARWRYQTPRWWHHEGAETHSESSPADDEVGARAVRIQHALRYFLLRIQHALR